MDPLISRIGAPEESTGSAASVALFFATWAALSVAGFILNRVENQHFPLVYIILMCGGGTVCLMLIAFAFRRPRPIEYSQDVSLEGSRLKIVKPSLCVIDFSSSDAYVLRRREGAPSHGSIRFLREEGDVTIYFHAPEEAVRGLWVSGDAGPPPGRWSGTPDYRDKFGNALLQQVREHKDNNRFWTLLEQVAERRPRRADDPDVVLLGDDDDDDSLSYRSSGRPGPKDAGYAAWLSGYGLQVSATVWVSDEHLVAECRDGRRRAFPLGHIALAREPGGLNVLCGEAKHSVRIKDLAHVEALLEGLRVSRS